MVIDGPFLELFSFAATTKPQGQLEARIRALLDSNPSNESLDSPTFDLINGSKTKADYLVGSRAFVAELKAISASPHERIERSLGERFNRPDGLMVVGRVDMASAIKDLPDGKVVNRTTIDQAGRVVRRDLKKANDQIGAIKDRLSLGDVGGLVVLMNDMQPLIDAASIAFALRAGFETAAGGLPHVTNVWASIESHRVAMPGGRTGYPQVHVFRSFERQREHDLIGQMLDEWGRRNGSRTELVDHSAGWDVMAPIYDGPPPILRPFGRGRASKPTTRRSEP